MSYANDVAMAAVTPRTTPDGQYIRGANSGRPVTVSHDIGGDYWAYAVATDKLAASRQPVKVTGDCRSGCGLVLALPKSQVAVAPDAKIMLHGAYRPAAFGGGQNGSVTADMMSRLPPEIRRFVATHGGLPPGRYGGQHLVITGRDLIAMGWPSIAGPQARALPTGAASRTPPPPTQPRARGRAHPAVHRAPPSYAQSAFAGGWAAGWQQLCANIARFFGRASV